MQLNKKGSSIIAILGVVLIVALLFPILLSYLSSFDLSANTRRKQDDFERFISSIRFEINDGVACAQLLGGLTLDPSQLNVMQTASVNTGFAGVPGPLVDGWQNSAANIEISKVQIKITKHSVDQNNNPQKITLDWPPFLGAFDKYEAELYFIPKNVTWNPDPVQFPKRVVKLYLNLLQSKATVGVVQQCFGPGSFAQACESSGGAYDGVNSPIQYRCNPDKRCIEDQQGLVTNILSCTSPFTASYVGNFNNSQKYLCLWCNRNKK